MTVKQLQELLKNYDPEALVYATVLDDDIALLVTDVIQDVLMGKEKTILLVCR